MPSPGLDQALARHHAVRDAGTPVPRVQHFGDPAGEASAAFTRGVVREQSTHAVIVLRGRERVEFVNRMCTNDATRVTPTFGIGAALTSAKGKLVDLARIAARGEELLLLGSAGQGAALKAWLEKYVVMEELAIVDATAEESRLLAFGPQAAAAVQQAIGVELAPADGGFAVAQGRCDAAPVLALGAGPAPFHGIELIAPAAAAGALFDRLVAGGLTPIGETAWSQVRVEAGIPLHGREISDNANPLEAGLLNAVSFNKGCYIGQEVVARLNSYAKVQRLLIGARFPAAVEPATVQEIFWDLLRVGHATSTTRSPRLDATLALAFIKNEYAKPGTPVYTVRQGERIDGVLCELPFR
ncbi:MAG: aminomethyl transferase family protein [Planctomycetes bacterium]|nr:aminomethyl transferase family protein [Planctomycetota bacterium]